jgi:DNA-binding transcriptional regulator YiaG
MLLPGWKVAEIQAGRDFARWLRGLRATLGLSQHALAGHVGVSRATVNRWEQGHTYPEYAQRMLLNQLAKENGYEPIPRRW